MIRSFVSLAVLASSLSTLVACGGNDTSTPDLAPFRDNWETVAMADFPYYDAEGAFQINTINVGGRIYTDNFVNRGDVIVRYDESFNATPSSPGQIQVEIRRFSWSVDQADAEASWDKIQPWISADSPANPGQPDDLDPTLDCTETWMDGCGVRVWYEGQVQPARVGADIRVTLPGNYVHQLNVTTEDNDDKDLYQNRGNVCLENMRGNAEVLAKSGVVYAIMPSDMTPAPTCTPAQIEACENFEDDEGNPAAWDPSCGCDTLGKLGINSTAAIEVVVDVPEALWANVNARNDDDLINAENCVSDLDGLAGAIDLMPSDQEWNQSRELNRPSDAAPEGSGYSVLVQSARCAPVFFTEDPDDYVGADAMVEDQESEPRGNIQVCNNCVRGTSCEDLLPGSF